MFPGGSVVLVSSLFLSNLSGAYAWLAGIAVLTVALVAVTGVLAVKAWNLSAPAPVRGHDL